MCEIGGDMTNLNLETKKFFNTVTNFFKPTKKCIHDLLKHGVGRLPVTRCRLERDDSSFNTYLNWREFPTELNIDTAGKDLWTGKLYEKGRYRIGNYMISCIMN